jgi:hypothetical protein
MYCFEEQSLYIYMFVRFRWTVYVLNEKSVQHNEVQKCYATFTVICSFFIYSSIALQPLAGTWPFFSFVIFFTVGLLGRTISSSQGRYLHTRQHKYRKMHTQTSMTCVGFEPTNPAFEWAKAVHALDRAAALIGTVICNSKKSYPLRSEYLLVTLIPVLSEIKFLCDLLRWQTERGTYEWRHRRTSLWPSSTFLWQF